jgi:hypothetical protein
MGPIKHKALINVDLGEGFGNWTITSDEDLLPFIDHANIACGFHASYVFLSLFVQLSEPRRPIGRWNCYANLHQKYDGVLLTHFSLETPSS